ncbi:hypothetical protein H0H92_002144 [Tricholoma furcatifolium]|nr:hypothetical protein H0H92_002144 [Tricholoma furcatifolium]
MYALSHRASVARHISRTTISFSRSNSASKGPEETEDPATSTPKPPSSRIASSWGNVTIPSREEILRNLSQETKAQTYTPDLSYLKGAKASGIASRLYSNNLSPPESDAAQNVQENKEADDPAKEKAARILAATLARKAAREAREKAAAATEKASLEAREARAAAHRAKREAASERAAQVTAERIAERLRREAIVPAPQRRQNIKRGQPQSNRSPNSRAARDGSKPSRPRVKFMIQATPSQDSSLANSQDDITLEMIEQGGDEKEPPAFMNPDVTFTNLDALFKPSLATRVEHDISSGQSSFTKDQMLKLRNAYGGDYQRFSSRTSKQCVTPPEQLGPVQHAHLILSERRELSLGARENALAIISSAASGSRGIKEVKVA